MKISHSRVTVQGQISIPAAVRSRLGIGPGSMLEWAEADGQVVVRRTGRYSSLDIHEAVFGPTPETRSLADMKEGIRKLIRKRHARG